jgi:hypothetical protein
MQDVYMNSEKRGKPGPAYHADEAGVATNSDEQNASATAVTAGCSNSNTANPNTANADNQNTADNQNNANGLGDQNNASGLGVRNSSSAVPHANPSGSLPTSSIPNASLPNASIPSLAGTEAFGDFKFHSGGAHGTNSGAVHGTNSGRMPMSSASKLEQHNNNLHNNSVQHNRSGLMAAASAAGGGFHQNSGLLNPMGGGTNFAGAGGWNQHNSAGAYKLDSIGNTIANANSASSNPNNPADYGSLLNRISELEVLLSQSVNANENLSKNLDNMQKVYDHLAGTHQRLKQKSEHYRTNYYSEKDERERTEREYQGALKHWRDQIESKAKQLEDLQHLKMLDPSSEMDLLR